MQDAGTTRLVLRRISQLDEELPQRSTTLRPGCLASSRFTVRLTHRAQALTGRAMDTLEELLDEKKHPSVRLGAARTVAEIGIHQNDSETILRPW